MIKRKIIGSSCLYSFAVLIILTILFKTNETAFLALAIALTAIPCVMLLWNLSVRKRTEVRLELPQVVSEVEGINGVITINQNGFIPAGKIYCRFTVTNKLTGESNVTESRFRAGRNEFSLTSEHCGKIEVTLTKVFLFDLFGLIPVKVGTQITESSVIIPKAFPVEITDIENSSTEEENQYCAESTKGSDFAEIFGLREYVPGDDIRGIHWKLSSKTDKTIFRIPGQPLYRALALYWDRSCGTPAERDALARVIVSVSLALTDTGMPFTLMTKGEYGAEIYEIITPDDITEAMPVLLESAPSDSEDVVPYTGNVFCFVCGNIRPDFSSVKYFCCSENGSYSDATCFTPQNYEKTFEETEFRI